MLLQEARIVGRIDDPRIVQVYDVGSQGSLSFVVMQLVSGETLGERVIRAGRLPQAEALAVMKEVLRGLAAAHKAGVVHRDLKPSNIMIDASGAVKLLDFGIAGVTGSEEMAPDATFSGSLDFMAPEQAFGAKPDPRMDLYSFGATYFFALTGAPPFRGQTPGEIMVKHREAPVPDVRELNREASPAIAALITKLMGKFPESRPATADEVLAELSKAGVVPVDPGGSPFRILPAPVEAKVGLAAELQAMGLPGAEAAAARLDTGPGIPEPPPPVDFASGRIPAQTWAVFAFLFVVFFGGSWSVFVHADWLAAGAAASVCAAVLAFSGARENLQRAVGFGLFCLSCWCYFEYGAGPTDGFPPPLPGLETTVLLFLGGILGAAGVYLGFGARPPEADLSAILLLAGGAVLLASGAARALPAGGGVDALGAQLGAAFNALASTGGLLRWTGLTVLYGAYRFAKFFEYDPASWSRRKTGDGRVINWNK
jgi:hypothetical protein